MKCNCELINIKYHNPCESHGKESEYGIIGDIPHAKEPGVGAFRIAYRSQWPFRKPPTNEELAVWSLIDLLGCEHPYSTQMLKCPVMTTMGRLTKVCFERHLKTELLSTPVKTWLAVGLMVRVNLFSLGAKQTQVYLPPKRKKLQDTMAVMDLPYARVICLGSPFTTEDWPRQALKYIESTTKTK